MLFNPYPDIRRAPPALLPGQLPTHLELMQSLRMWRVEQSLTREELSLRSGVPASTIKRAERFGKISLQSFAAK